MKTFSNLSLALLACFLSSISVSYSEKEGSELVDSLKSRLILAKEDTSKVRLLGKLSFQYYRFDTDSGICYAEKAITLAEKLNWGLGLAFSYNYLGTNYAVKGNYPKALACFYKSLSQYTAIGDKQGIAFISNNLGNFYRIQENYTKAIEFVNKSIVLNKELNNKLDLAKNYNNLGSVYNSLNQIAKSDEFYFNALELAREINNKELIALIVTNIAENQSLRKNYCKAIEYSMEAIRISEELGATYDIAVSNGYLGEIYFKIANDSNHVPGNCPYYSDDRRKNLENAKKYLTNSIVWLDKINDLSVLSENALILSEVFEKLNDPKNALIYHKKYSESKDSAFSKDHSVEIANIEKKREVELRDNQIVIQQLTIEKKNAQIFSQIVIFIMILLVTFIISLYYHVKRKKQKTLLVESEKRKVESDIRKQNEILEQRVVERTQQLKIINQELTIHTNDIEQFTYIVSHDLQEPLRTLTNFTRLIKENYDNKLDEDARKYIDFIYTSAGRMQELVKGLVVYSLLGKERVITMVDCKKIVDDVLNDMDDSIRKHKAEIIVSDMPVIKGYSTELRLLFQNLINNAIKFHKPDTPPVLKISAHFHENEYFFKLEDNGIGIEDKDKEKIFIIFKRMHNQNEYEGTGIGLAHCKKIVELHHGRIWVESTKGTGAKFMFTIPVSGF